MMARTGKPTMKQALVLAGLLASFGAQADLLVDTGAPTSAIAPYVLDSSNRYAGKLGFAQDMALDSISTYLVGVAAGETFTVSLYADDGGPGLGEWLSSSTATIASSSSGWSGAGGLGWTVVAGNYWVGIEVGATDTAGADSFSGALLTRGVPTPLLQTAFSSGANYLVTATPLDFALQVQGVRAVPEPAMWALWLAGAAGVAGAVRRRVG
jgi:hypothetical protein